MSALYEITPDQIKLERASVHIFQQTQGDGLTLVTSTSPLERGSTAVPEDFDSFERYLQLLTVDAAQNDPKTQTALFKKQQSPDSVRNLLDPLFASPTEPNLFQSASQQLAELLKDKLKAGAVRPAYFILAQLLAAGERCYAILKLNLDEHLEIVVGQTEDQPTTVRVHRQDLPTSSEHKDKFAFVLDPAQRRKFDLLVTDRKYDKRSLRKVARYFLDDFLTAEFVEDSTFLTAQFIDVVRSFAKKKREEFAEEKVKLDLYYSGLEHFVRRNSIGLKEFLENTLPDQPGLQEELRKELRTAGVAKSTFKVDPACAGEKTSWQRLTLSNRIWIAGEREVMSEALKIARRADGYRFQIEAASYVEN